MEDTIQTPEHTEAPLEDKAEVTGNEDVVTNEPIAPTPDNGADQGPELTDAEESYYQSVLAKKGFKSEEDLAKSYVELEKKFSSEAAERANYERLVDTLIQEEDPEDYNDVQSLVEAQVAPLRAKLDFQNVAKRHSDFPEYHEKIAEIIEGMDSTQRKSFYGEKGIELLYKIAKAEMQDSNLEKAKEEGKKELTAAEVEKIRADVHNTSTAKRPSGSQHFTKDQVANMSLDEFTANESEITRQMKAGLIK